MLQQSNVRKWAAVLVLALGMGTVWGVAVAIIGSTVGALMPGSPKTSESLVVVVDGTPLIQSQIAGNYLNTKLRTLDGKSIELDRENWLQGASLGKPYQEPGLFDYPIVWRQRIAGCSDLDKPPANWQLMRDNMRPGHAYFIGYDTISKLGLGFLGRNGFRSTVPPIDDQFDMGNQTFSWGSSVAASPLRINYGGTGYHYSGGNAEDNRRLANWLVFLMDGNNIQEVDLRNRTIRTIDKLEQLVGLGITAQPLPETEATEVIEEIDSQRKTSHRLLARCTERIVAINPFDHSKQVFPLPARLQRQDFSAFLVADDKLLIQVAQGWWEQGSVVGLLWINTAGEVQREESLHLAGYTGPNAQKQLFAMAVTVPSLLPWAIGAVGVAPLSAVQTHQADGYVSALSKTLSECWFVFLLLIALSVVLTWLVYHWQKKYYRKNTQLWCAMIFAFTVPGLLAYWLMYRGTVIETCPECNKKVPRNRDACAGCQQPFAEPKLLGTEVFA